MSPRHTAVHRHGAGWQSHGRDRHHRQPAASEAVPEGLCHLPAGH